MFEKNEKLNDYFNVSVGCPLVLLCFPEFGLCFIMFSYNSPKKRPDLLGGLGGVNVLTVGSKSINN